MSKLWRVCSSEFLIDSSWLARSSSAGRMSNQWYFSTLARYSLSIAVPLAILFGPPLAGLPTRSFSIRSRRVRLDDAQLVVQVEAIALQLVVDDLLGALVALIPRG